jgi:hypothetical protein
MIFKAVIEEAAMNDQPVRLLVGLLDAMDDHFDGRLSDMQFIARAEATYAAVRAETDTSSPAVQEAVRALASFLQDRSVKASSYEKLRHRLADLPDA